MRLNVSLGTAVAALALALASATFIAGPASAHDYLVASSPVAGSTVTDPLTKVTLTFDDVVLYNPAAGLRSIVVVTDDQGKHYETGCSSALDRVVTVPVTLGGAGNYTATWDIVSADGHPVTSSIQFSYAPKAPSAASTNAGNASSPCKFANSGQNAPSAASSNPGNNSGASSALNGSSAGSSPSSIAVILIALAGTAAIVGVVILIFFLASRRTRGTLVSQEPTEK
ncbi:MAG: hypothetical protein RJA35_64 [Actinomycetota bacterium]